MINKKTAPNEEIFLLVKKFWAYCMGKTLGVPTFYVNTNQNKNVDNESWKLKNNPEWTMETAIFYKIISSYGPAITDLLASRINAREGRYNYYTPDTQASGRNNFSFSWKQ